MGHGQLDQVPIASNRGKGLRQKFTFRVAVVTMT